MRVSFERVNFAHSHILQHLEQDRVEENPRSSSQIQTRGNASVLCRYSWVKSIKIKKPVL